MRYEDVGQPEFGVPELTEDELVGKRRWSPRAVDRTYQGLPVKDLTFPGHPKEWSDEPLGHADIDSPRLRPLADAVARARTNKEFEAARKALTEAIRGSGH